MKNQLRIMGNIKFIMTTVKSRTDPNNSKYRNLNFRPVFRMNNQMAYSQFILISKSYQIIRNSLVLPGMIKYSQIDKT